MVLPFQLEKFFAKKEFHWHHYYYNKNHIPSQAEHLRSFQTSQPKLIEIYTTGE